MIRKVRKKIASSISRVEEVEDFNFSNWLKKPSVQEQPIHAITSSLKDTSQFIAEISFPDNSQFEFDLAEPQVSDEIKLYAFSRIRSNAIFFMMHNVPDKGVTNSEIELKPLSYSAKNVEFLIKFPALKEIRVKFSTWTPVEYNCTLEVPEIFNYLSEMVPEVYNIDLLNLEELFGKAKTIDIHSVVLDSFRKTKIKKQSLPDLPQPKKIYKVKIPSIGNYKSSLKKIAISTFSQPTISESPGIKFSEVKNWFANVQLSGVDSLLFYSSMDEQLSSNKSKKIKGLKNVSEVRELLKFSLSNVHKADWEERKDLHIALQTYEEAGVKFLVENDYALLQDEFGIDKEKEVIAALKFLFGNRVIKSALIISSAGKKGNPELSVRCNIEIGWSDKIKKYCPELPLTIVEGSNDKRADLWNKSGVINLVDLETIINDYHLKILEENRLKRFDCIIIDEVHLVFLKKDRGRELISAIKPPILWATSSIIDNHLQQELNNWLGSSVSIDKVKIRQKESIIKDAPKFIWHEEWIDADEDQLNEFKVSIVECQKELRRVLESGNPLRFTANIFTQLHRLNQVGNFAPGNIKSPKTDLLLEQVATIKDNGKKVLILSQYDRLGTKKIEQLLTQYGINHILALGSLSIDEMKKSISLFNSKKEIVAFVTDAKTSKLNFSDVNVPYVIRFDQWWNPTSKWELEDMFKMHEVQDANKESINVYSYYVSGTIDQQVRELLHYKELLNKNIFELMPLKVYDELISVDEWLRIFNMPASNETQNELAPEGVQKLIKTSTLNFYRTILSKFFFKLGYTNVDIIDLPNSSSFNIVGETKRNSRNFFLNARVFIEGKIDKKTLEDILLETASSSNNKIFVITKGEFPEGSEKILRENVTLLDGFSLSKYLIQFGIVNAQTTDTAKELFS